MRVAKPEILNDVARHRAIVVEAHAGTGKTFTIEHLVVDLVLSGVPMQELLVVTYTEKAARELKERVRNIIERLLYSPESLPQAAAHEPGWDLGPMEFQLLRAALFSYELAQISTIHSFCQRLLKETSFVNGGRMGRTLVSGDEVFARAFGECFREKLGVEAPLRQFVEFWVGEHGKTLDGLRDVLQRALNAGAGRVRAQNAVVFPVEATLPPSALAERLEALRAFLRDNAGRLGGTKMKALRNALGHVFLQSSPVRNAKMSFDAWRQALDSAPVPAEERGLLSFLAKGSVKLSEVLEGLKDAHWAEARAAGLEAEATRWVEFLRGGLPTLRERLAAFLVPPLRRHMDILKAHEGLFDFDDLLCDVERALRDDPEGRFLDVLRSRFSVAIIDEFQDTDPIQWFIFRKAFFESDRHRLVLVGDPKQAIYGFRGADVRTYLQACGEVLEAAARDGHTGSDAPLVRLDRNFRSTHEIIAGYNAIFSSEGPFFSQGGIHYRHPVACGQPEALRLENGDGERVAGAIRLLRIKPGVGDSPLDAASFRKALHGGIVREIQALVPQDGQKSCELVSTRGGKRPLSHGDVFVLVRTNPEAAEVAQALRTHGIPCTLFQTESVFATEEALELELLLEAVLDPSDTGKSTRALLTRFFALRLGDLGVLRGEELPPLPMGMLRSWHECLETLTVPRLLSLIYSESGVLRRELATSVSERSLTNYLHLAEILTRWHAASRANMREVLLRLKRARAALSAEDSEEMQRLETDARAVQILTMHKSKGLEAAVVFLGGGFSASPRGMWSAVERENDGVRVRLLSDSSHPRVAGELELLEAAEDERLLYVALTRPTHLLYLPYFTSSDANIKEGISVRLCHRLRDLVDEDGTASPGDRAAFAAVSAWRAPSEGVSGVGWEKTDAGPSLRSSPAQTEAFFPADARVALENLRIRHRAPGTSSYTRLKHGHATEAADRLDEVPVPVATDAGPRGATFGICFHECMENLDVEGIAASETWEEWMAREGVSASLTESLRRNGVEETHREALARWVFEAARLPLGPLAGVELPPFCALSEAARELEFCLPWPEDFHGQGNAAWKAERGFLVGACDVVFRHEGRLYVVDWKTDSLADYGPESLRARFQGEYRLQALIYTLAACRLAGVAGEEDYEEKIGGHIYVFVRGPAVVAERLTWRQVQAFEAELRAARGMTWRGGTHAT